MCPCCQDSDKSSRFVFHWINPVRYPRARVCAPDGYQPRTRTSTHDFEDVPLVVKIPINHLVLFFIGSTPFVTRARVCVLSAPDGYQPRTRTSTHDFEDVPLVVKIPINHLVFVFDWIKLKKSPLPACVCLCVCPRDASEGDARRDATQTHHRLVPD
jgi:hypothetical protein